MIKQVWAGMCAVIGLGLAGAASVSAAAASQVTPVGPVALVEGQNYRTLATPVATENPNKVEVLEAFSYGCIHCFEFEPSMRAWKAKLPADVQLEFLPATFNSTFELYARGFYAAKSLGLVDATHEKIFDAIWKDGMQAKDAATLANLYARVGADHDRFLDALNSIGIQAAISGAGNKAQRLKLEGTPTLYVDGKYQVLTNGATSYDDIMQRLDAVVAKARAEHKAAQR